MEYMQLSKRLHAVASLVTVGNRVVDIGCDHAYTSIYLAENQISPKIIAMDVNQGPIDRAKENIMKYGYDSVIEVRKSNGLEKVEPGEIDTILIAGMGGGLTLQILSEHMEVVHKAKELVLQPQSDIKMVRVMLQENGLIITKENMIKEDGKYYVMMKAEQSTCDHKQEEYKLLSEEHFTYGRLLLEQNHPVLYDFMLWDLGLCQNIIDSLAEEQTENQINRKKEIDNKIALIKKGLGYYE
jgi:tRNA (adenine22-N1)-methyltransferase